MHDFFTPEQDHQLGSQLRREAMAARREPERLPARISSTIRSVDSSSANSRAWSSHTRTIFYALAAMLCVALALPTLWNRFTAAPPVEREATGSLVTIAPAIPKEESTIPPKPAESPTPSQPEIAEDDLALITADVQAAVDTLLATLPVDVDIDALVP